MKISINIPTNNPDSYFLNFHGSLPFIFRLRDYCEVELFYIFQYPWTIEQIKKVKIEVEDLGFKFNSTVEHSRDVPSMTYLRNLGIIYSSNSDYFFFADDNLIFSSGTPKYQESSGERYAQVLEYLETYKNCGFVMCEGSLGGAIQKWEISSTKTGLFATARGLILRNIGKEKIFRSTNNLIGGLEESVACYHIIEEGFYPAKQFNNPTKHPHSSRPGVNGSITIHNEEIWDSNCAKYIRDRYDDQSWTHNSKKWPSGLKEKYLKNNGDKDIFKQRVFRMNF